MERISNVIELKEDDFHYNVYNELKEMYKERTNYSDRYVDFDDFKDEYLEYVKDNSNENFEKYNSNCNYHIIILGSVECKLYMLKKDFLEIEIFRYAGELLLAGISFMQKSDPWYSPTKEGVKVNLETCPCRAPDKLFNAFILLF